MPSDVDEKLCELMGVGINELEELREELRKREVIVIAGGPSSEAEISIESGAAINEGLRALGYNTSLLKFKDPRELAEKLRSLAPTRTLIFVALHGRYGEDGTVQGLLESLRFSYTGSNVSGSVLGMNKGVTYSILSSAGLPVPKTVRIPIYERKSPSEVEEHLRKLITMRHLSFPLVIKPSSSGSTVGVSIVSDEDELTRGIQEAIEEDPHELIIQEYIDGRELTVPLIEGIDGKVRALPVLEIVPEGGFYDYRAKYQSDRTRYLVPAPIPDSLELLLKWIAAQAFKLLRCNWLARADFRVSRRGKPYLLELNTIPGMTSHSLVPKAAAHLGVDFNHLVELLALISLARSGRDA